MTTDPRDGIPCMLMRGGTSKGAYFLAADLPSDPAERDALLLRIMGSPDPAQIDGLGGAHPLTSKVAIISASTTPDADVDYLFLQVAVDEALVSTTQTCGNLLAGVGPFALERGLVTASGDSARIRIALRNTGDVATATFPTSDGRPEYAGDRHIDGVPGTAGAIDLEVTAGPGKALFPSGSVVDVVEGLHVTLVDNGMPTVLIAAADVGASGAESPDELEGDAALRERIERLRRAAGERMGLGDVAEQTVPKVILLAPAQAGGAIGTRAFIPHRVHTSIGVLMAASVAAAVRVPGTVAADIPSGPASSSDGDGPLAIEHPSGSLDTEVTVHRDADGTWRAASLSHRTARKIFDGRVFPGPIR
ncbi:4-oxalomesaconate tautomerase [Microbacterium sp. NPDC089189]|uniref:4-oxalomesaconate tautomerase n=1 Tax=Microbacterium sp. NPDC089189 TaxID=3154972 RepID=UPI00341DD1D6